MAVLAIDVMPARGKGHKGMLWLTTENLVAFNVQAQPGALSAPLRDGRAIEPGLLHRQRGLDQIVNQAQHIGAVARAHQGFGARGRVPGVISPAAGA